MALKTDQRAPPRHFRPQSDRQRRAVLASIDAAERETLNSAPSPLTADPYLLKAEPSKAPAQASRGPTPVPLRLIRRPELFSECGHGTCPITPGCTGRCYLRQAHQALRNSIDEREAVQPEPVVPVNHAMRRIVWVGLIVHALGVAALGLWAFTR